LTRDWDADPLFAEAFRTIGVVFVVASTEAMEGRTRLGSVMLLLLLPPIVCWVVLAAGGEAIDGDELGIGGR